MPANTLPPDRRMRRRGEFQRVFDAGRRVHGRYLTLVFALSPQPASRLGIVASRKLGGAVVRNRAKRLIREAFRTTPPPAPPVDLIVIPKGSAVSVTTDELTRDYQAVLKRITLSKS